MRGYLHVDNVSQLLRKVLMDRFEEPERMEFIFRIENNLFTSNGFRLKYVAPGRSKRLICCSGVKTESRFSIALTYI